MSILAGGPMAPTRKIRPHYWLYFRRGANFKSGRFMDSPFRSRELIFLVIEVGSWVAQGLQCV